MENIISHVNLTHPGVRMACVFSSGVDTPAKLVYRVSQEELLFHCICSNFDLCNRKDFLTPSQSGSWAMETARWPLQAWRHVSSLPAKRKTLSGVSGTSNMPMFSRVKKFSILSNQLSNFNINHLFRTTSGPVGPPLPDNYLFLHYSTSALNATGAQHSIV